MQSNILQYTYLIFALFSLVGQANAGEKERYLALVFGSTHFGEELNDFNPGILIGYRWTSNSHGLEYHLEGGIFRNSYKESSPIFMWGVSHSLFEIESVEFRGGLSVGTAYYGELAPHLEREFGIPNIDGFIPLAAVTFSVRARNLEYRFSVLPGDDVFGALNLSAATRF